MTAPTGPQRRPFRARLRDLVVSALVVAGVLALVIVVQSYYAGMWP